MTRYRGRSAESNTLLFSNQFLFFSWGEALFLNVPNLIFLIFSSVGVILGSAPPQRNGGVLDENILSEK